MATGTAVLMAFWSAFALCGAVAWAAPLELFPTDIVLETGVLMPNEQLTYTFSVASDSEFAFLYVNDTRIDMRLTLNAPVAPNVTREWGSSANPLPSMLLKPSTTGRNCRRASGVADSVNFLESGAPSANETRCAFVLVLSPRAVTSPVPFRLRGHNGVMLTFAGRPSFGASLRRYQSQFFGVEVLPEHLDVQILLKPEPNDARVDLDLSVYGEARPLSFFRPSPDNRNHFKNAPEEALITRQSAWFFTLPSGEPYLYMADVVCPGETEADSNPFVISVTSKFVADDSIVISLSSLVAAMLIGVMCMLLTALVIARRRSRQSEVANFQLGGDAGGRRPVVRGATEEEIEMLPRGPFDPSSLSPEDAKCAICLSDFQSGELLRTLPCEHRYHVACIDRWLQTSKRCPMCQQDITAAKNVFGGPENRPRGTGEPASIASVAVSVPVEPSPLRPPSPPRSAPHGDHVVGAPRQPADRHSDSPSQQLDSGLRRRDDTPIPHVPDPSVDGASGSSPAGANMPM
jgi:hypothetical protein